MLLQTDQTCPATCMCMFGRESGMFMTMSLALATAGEGQRRRSHFLPDVFIPGLKLVALSTGCWWSWFQDWQRFPGPQFPTWRAIPSAGAASRLCFAVLYVCCGLSTAAYTRSVGFTGTAAELHQPYRNNQR